MQVNVPCETMFNNITSNFLLDNEVCAHTSGKEITWPKLSDEFQTEFNAQMWTNTILKKQTKQSITSG
jgi:hypothetical protein